MTENILTKVIGSGVNYPIIIDDYRDENGNVVIGKDGSPIKGWYIVSGDISLIEQNLTNIITTLLGSRIRQEDFGSRVSELLEEPNSQVTAFLASKFVSESILTWESRISGLRIETEQYLGSLKISVYYKLKTNIIQTENLLTLEYII